ncbi:hypothetical protein PHMEG_00013273 [Phytophthora megakarya]|uniref:SCD domain-containing protein n=1 Tax=Phytophthora megakarya TaxID=4795 RepID=A0A225W8S9_9STRA|nr:hypothetical protein PHMEG_00013273 [Phytophthora megakarya]
MSTRRGSRLRRKPTPIYQVEDTRDGEEELGTEQEEQEMRVANEQSEESSGEGEDDDFTPSGTRLKKPKTPHKVQTPVTKARSSRRKRSPWSETRHLRPAKEAKKSKNGTAAEGGSDEVHGNDRESLFEAIKSRKTPLENLLSEWRERFEEDNEKATREVLNLVLLACGGTSPCVPESEPLAQLDMNMSHLMDHVVEDLENANGEYPIMSRGRGTKKFQRNFEEFWEVLVKECYESEILFTSEIANTFIDWLTTLSSSELRPIRHTSTVAILALSNSLVRTAASISEQLAIATRQLNAETNSPGTTPGSRKSPNIRKVALLKENKVLYESRLQQIWKLVNSVFTGVVVHRYRDVMPEIRVVTMQCLGHWITTLPDRFLKDNFLKYLGWLLSDKSASVRIEVVEILCELYGNESFKQRMELFTSRFLSRYLELCTDVDVGVVEECIHLLIAVDKLSLISADIGLQPVEKLVFDAEHEDIRKAAAEFVCLQYDAFGVAVSKTKDTQLKKEQLNTQAIALVEFAEEYIQNHGIPEDAVETLVDAFWGLDDCLVLQDWRSMTDLLLADKSAPDLSNEQQTILLRLLVASVSKLVGSTSNRGASAAAKRESERLREEVTVAYCKDIPRLFQLYQADSDKLALLLQLIPMLTLKSEVIGHHSGLIKELLEKLKHAYLLHSGEELLTSLTLSIAHLVQTEHASLKREAEIIVHELVQDVIDKINHLLEADVKLYDALAIARHETSKTKGKNKRGRKTKSAKSKEISDVEYDLRIGLCRLKCLVKYLNIRDHLPPDLESSRVDVADHPEMQQGRMDNLVTAMGELLHRRSKSVSELHEGFRHVDTIKHVLTIVYSDLLWITAPIFKGIEDDKRSVGATSENADAEVDRYVSIQIQKVCRSRSTLEEALVSVLEMHLVRTNQITDEEHKESEKIPDLPSVNSMEPIQFEDEDLTSYVRDAQRFAFLTFCDVRCLFVEKFQDANPPYNALKWELPNVLVLLTHTHFDSEMDDAEQEPEFEDDMMENDPVIAEAKSKAISEWHEKQQQKAALLVALGRVSLCNPSKKRPAASVMEYLTSNDQASVEVVKAFGKKVKADAPVRYLEIQMIALRELFNNQILFWKQEIEAVEADEDNMDDEIAEQLAELKEKVQNNDQKLKELAKRFSQSLGVGKVPSSLRGPFLRFLCEGVRFALEQPNQFEFLQAMRPYLPRMDPSSMVQLHEYFMERLQVLDVPDDDDNLDQRWRSLFDFQSSINSVSFTNGRKRVSTDMMYSPPVKSKRRSASLEPTPMQGTSIPEDVDEENTERQHDEDAENVGDDKSEASRTDEGEQVDHNNRHRSSTRTRTNAASLPRKRQRRQRNDEGTSDGNIGSEQDNQHQDESKNVDDTPGRSDHKMESRLEVIDHNQSGAASEQDDDTIRNRRKRRRA